MKSLTFTVNNEQYVQLRDEAARRGMSIRELFLEAKGLENTNDAGKPVGSKTAPDKWRKFKVKEKHDT